MNSNLNIIEIFFYIFFSIVGEYDGRTHGEVDNELYRRVPSTEEYFI